MVELVPILRGFNQFEARLYDARIMRWNVPDPAGQFWSPYNGMGNDWINGVDPDGREWYTNWLGGQKWFDGADNSNWYWSINSGSGFDYRMDDGSIIHNMNMGDVTITGKIPVWKSNGTINTMHPNYAQNQRKKERMYKYESQQESWEGKDGLINKGLPTMAIVATGIFTGGLTAFGSLAAYYGGAGGITTLTLDVLDVANSIHTLAGSPLYGSKPSLLINGANIAPDIHGIAKVGQVPTNPVSAIISTVGTVVDLTKND